MLQVKKIFELQCLAGPGKPVVFMGKYDFVVCRL